MTAAAGLVREFFAAYRDHDVDRMVALCAPDGAFDYVPMGGQGRGHIAETGRTVGESLIGAFPDLTNEVHSVLDNGSGNAAAEVTISGTQAQDFAGIPSKGHRYSLPHAFFFHADAGHINRIRAYWDNASFLQQLT